MPGLDYRPFSTGLLINTVRPHDHSLRTMRSVRAQMELRQEQAQKFRAWAESEGMAEPVIEDGERRFAEIIDFYRNILETGNWEMWGDP